MKKFFLLTAIAILFIASSFAQNVGIGTTSPKVSFNVAAGKTVLFGTDIPSQENKLMWLTGKGAFRAGDYFGSGVDSIGLNSTATGTSNR